MAITSGIACPCHKIHAQVFTHCSIFQVLWAVVRWCMVQVHDHRALRSRAMEGSGDKLMYLARFTPHCTCAMPASPFSRT